MKKLKKIIESLRKNKNKKNKIVLRYLSIFYINKNNHDYTKARKEFYELQLTNVKHDKNIIEIKCGRPGLLIGMRGENINNLLDYLKEEYDEKIKIKIIEDIDIQWPFSLL